MSTTEHFNRQETDKNNFRKTSVLPGYYAAQHPTRAQITRTQWWKPEIKLQKMSRTAVLKFYRFLVFQLKVISV
jgi:hypothetical protein